MGRKSKSGMNSSAPTSYNEYSSVSDADAAMGFGNGGEADRWTEGLTAEEKRAINNYSLAGFKKINSTLRKLKDGKDVDPNSSVGKRVNNIENAINRYNLTQPTIFDRRAGEEILFTDKKSQTEYMRARMNGTADKMVLDRLNSMVGKVIHDKGFTSTSASKDSTLKTGDMGVGDTLRYHIKTPKGKGIGAYIPGASHYGNSESEFLFNRGSAFRVTGVRQRQMTGHQPFIGQVTYTAYDIDMEYVGRSK